MVSRSVARVEDFTPTAGGTEDTLIDSFDVSAWQSYELRGLRSTSSTIASDREFNNLVLRWYTDDAGVGSDVPSHTVQFRWMTDLPLSVTGPHHGERMELLHRGGSQNRKITWTLAHTSLYVPVPRAMHQTGLILNASWGGVGAGSTSSTEHALLTPGPVTLFLGVVSQPGDFLISAGGQGLAYVPVSVAEKSKTLHIEAPRASMSVLVINRGATSSGDYSARAITGHA